MLFLITNKKNTKTEWKKESDEIVKLTNGQTIE